MPLFLCSSAILCLLLSAFCSFFCSEVLSITLFVSIALAVLCITEALVDKRLIILVLSFGEILEHSVLVIDWLVLFSGV